MALSHLSARFIHPRRYQSLVFDAKNSVRPTSTGSKFSKFPPCKNWAMDRNRWQPKGARSGLYAGNYYLRSILLYFIFLNILSQKFITNYWYWITLTSFRLFNHLIHFKFCRSSSIPPNSLIFVMIVRAVRALALSCCKRTLFRLTNVGYLYLKISWNRSSCWEFGRKSAKSTRRISGELGASKDTIHRLIKTLVKSYRRCRYVSHELTPQQAQHRVDICRQLIGNPMDDRFIRKIVTSIKWVYYNNPDASKQWQGPCKIAKVIVKGTYRWNF